MGQLQLRLAPPPPLVSRSPWSSTASAASCGCGHPSRGQHNNTRRLPVSEQDSMRSTYAFWLWTSDCQGICHDRARRCVCVLERKKCCQCCCRIPLHTATLPDSVTFSCSLSLSLSLCCSFPHLAPHCCSNCVAVICSAQWSISLDFAASLLASLVANKRQQPWQRQH